MFDRPHTVMRARIAQAVFRHARWPFRLAFTALERVRCGGAPRTVIEQGVNGDLAAHARKSLGERAVYGYERACDVVRHLRTSADPRALQVLSIGSKSEIELYYLWLLFGFSWKRLDGVDIVSASRKIQVADMAGTLPFPDNHFDVILACHCLEKSLDPARTRDEIRRVAKPGARVLVAGSGPQGPAVSPVPIRPFEGGVHGLIDLYGLQLKEIEYMNERVPHGMTDQFHIIFRVTK